MGFELTQRLSSVIALREKGGMTFKLIGVTIGCGAARAASLYHEAKRRQKFHEERANNPYYGLSVRAANCVNNANLMTRAQIAAAIKDGTLHPRNVHRCRNYGWKTHVEIHKWLGLPEPQKRRPKICPHCGGKL